MNVVELTPALGVEVLDADARGPFSAEEIDLLRRELDRHHLLLLRDQDIAGEDQVRFAARFGPLVAERQMWNHVSNVRPDGIVREGALLFHSDFAFARQPTLAISLHALEMPESGSSTRFANAARAVDLLDPALRTRLERLRVVNIYDFHWPDDRRIREHQLSPGSPRTEHPVIGPHPRTGVPVLYANEMHTDRIAGLPEAESEALLAAIFAVLYADENLYEHHWRVGDLVLWDNVALHHGRPAFPVDQPRTLRRVVLGNYTPAELVPNLHELLA